MANPFANQKKPEVQVEKPKERVGGDAFTPLESGIYDAEIALAYAQLSTAANSQTSYLNVHLKLEGVEREYRENLLVTGREGNRYFMRDGKAEYLSGYLTANELCYCATGHDLDAQEVEEKTVRLYDFTERKEIDKLVPVMTSILTNEGALPVKVAIIKQKVNKQEKDGNGGYRTLPDTRYQNVIVKVFHAETGLTMTEIEEGLGEPAFLPEWEKKWTGKEQDRSKKIEGAGNDGKPQATQQRSGGSTTPGAAAAGAAKGANLFNRGK